MKFVREYVNFNRIETFINIDKYEPEDIVKGYSFTTRLEDTMALVLTRLVQRAEKNSFFVIGQWGTGKTHFLAFLESVLTIPRLRDKVRSKKIRATLQKLETKKFAVIKSPLRIGPAVSLREFFYRKIETELGIKSDPKLETDRNIENVLHALGHDSYLVVIFDELADFLASKTGHELREDVRFIRELGEVSKQYRFSFFGAFQENLFDPTIPASLTAQLPMEAQRILDRYDLAILTTEEIKKVCIDRVLIKNDQNRKALAQLYAELRVRFPYVRFPDEDFIDLYPVHPSVFEIIEHLRRFFSQRSAIRFVMDAVEEKLNQEWASLVTIRDMWRHYGREFRTLTEFVDLIGTYNNLKRETLRRAEEYLVEESGFEKAKVSMLLQGVLDSLALLHVAEREATVKELANLLLIGEEEGKDNYIDVKIVLDALAQYAYGRIVSSGAELDAVYKLMPGKAVDVEALIRQRTEYFASRLDALDLGRAIAQDGLAPLLQQEIVIWIPDRLKSEFARWKSGNVDRKGYTFRAEFIEDIERASNYLRGNEDVDYVFVAVTPGLKVDRSKIEDLRLVVWEPAELEAGDRETARRFRAIRNLREEGRHPDLDPNFAAEEERVKKELKKVAVKLYFDRGKIGHFSTFDIPLSTFGRQDRVDFGKLKEEVLDPVFKSRYPEHPLFRNIFKPINAKSLVDDFIAPKRVEKGARKLDSLIKDFAEPLDLVVDTGTHYELKENSSYIRVLEESLDTKPKKWSDILSQLHGQPYGIDRHIAETLFWALMRLGKAQVAKKEEWLDLSKWSQARELVLAKCYVRKMPLLEEAPKLAEILRVLGLSIGDIASAEKQMEALNSLRGIADEMLQLLPAKEKINSLPFDIGELIRKTNNAHQLIILFNEALTKKELKEFINEFYDKANELEETKIWLIEVKSLLEDALELHTAKEYLTIAADVAQKLGRSKLLSSIRSMMDDLTDNLVKSDARRAFFDKLSEVKEDYAIDYVSAHSRVRGELAPFSDVEKIAKSHEYSSLAELARIHVHPSISFSRIEERIHHILAFRCDKANPKSLIMRPKCECGFPDGEILDINTELPQIRAGIQEGLKQYRNMLLAEEDTIKRNIEYLDPNSQKLVKAFLKERKFPKPLTSDFVDAMNKALENIVEVELDLYELFEATFKGVPPTWQQLIEDLPKALEKWRKSQKVPEGASMRIRIVRRD